MIPAQMKVTHWQNLNPKPISKCGPHNRFTETDQIKTSQANKHRKCQGITKSPLRFDFPSRCSETLRFSPGERCYRVTIRNRRKILIDCHGRQRLSPMHVRFVNGLFLRRKKCDGNFVSYLRISFECVRMYLITRYGVITPFIAINIFALFLFYIQRFHQTLGHYGLGQSRVHFCFPIDFYAFTFTFF